MRPTLLTTVVLSFFCRGVNSFEWTSDLQDGAGVYACVDDNVTMRWRYAVQEEEVVDDVKWYFDPGNNSQALVDQRKDLKAQQERLAVYDNNTGQLHVQLSCGDYIFTGHPPVSVEWTFPSGETQLVSTHIDGKFFLTLPNPVEGGNYKCRLWSKLPPVSCLPHNASVFEVSTLTVDEVKARLSLLEGEQEIRNDKIKFLIEMDRLREENRNLTEIISSQHRDGLKLDSKKVMFDARLSVSFTHFSPGKLVVFHYMRRNEGNAYNPATGVFTAPFNGTYFFVLTAASVIGYSSLSLGDNGSTFCQVEVGNVAVSCVATVYRAQGQQVWVTSSRSSDLVNSYSSFVGFSLYLDIP